MSRLGEESDMPDPFIISPAGFLAAPNWPIYPNSGSNTGTYTVALAQKVSGSILARGRGTTLITQGVTLLCGTLDVQMVAPTAGTQQAVAFLVDNAQTPSCFAGVYIDTTNRVGALITNAAGSTVVQVSPGGSSIAAGTPLNIHLAWDSRAPYAVLTVNGTNLALTTSPSASWSVAVPVALQLGVGNISGDSDFVNATGIQLVQISPASPSAPAKTTVAQVDSDSATLAGAATMTLAVKVAHAPHAAITGQGSVVANATKTP